MTFALCSKLIRTQEQIKSCWWARMPRTSFQAQTRTNELSIDDFISRDTIKEKKRGKCYEIDPPHSPSETGPSYNILIV